MQAHAFIILTILDDQYAVSIETLCNEMVELLETNPNRSDDFYIGEAGKIIASLNNQYPKINFSTYSSQDTLYFCNFMSEFVSDIEKYGVVEASNIAETQLLLMSNSQLKNDLLCAVSEIKFGIFYNDPSLAPTAYENRVNNCVRNTNGRQSFLAEIRFYATLPVSALWLMADCMVEAAVRPNSPLCH